MYTLVLSVGILYAVKYICGGLRVSDSEEEKGLDISEHGEHGYVQEMITPDSIVAK